MMPTLFDVRVKKYHIKKCQVLKDSNYPLQEFIHSLPLGILLTAVIL